MFSLNPITKNKYILSHLYFSYCVKLNKAFLVPECFFHSLFKLVVFSRMLIFLHFVGPETKLLQIKKAIAYTTVPLLLCIHSCQKSEPTAVGASLGKTECVTRCIFNTATFTLLSIRKKGSWKWKEWYLQFDHWGENLTNKTGKDYLCSSKCFKQKV